MDVQLQLELNEEEEKGFRDLILLCNKEDETDYDTGLDYDFFYSIRNEEKKDSGIKEDYLAILMGYKLGEQEKGKDILLCTAFVHPYMRGQGLFTGCTDALYDDFRGLKIFRISIASIFWKKLWKSRLPFREKGKSILMERYSFQAITKKRFTFTGLWWKIDFEDRERERLSFVIV